MKRYFFEPGAVQCYRKRGVRAFLGRAANVCRGAVRAVASVWSTDSIAKFVLELALMATIAACVGMVAGRVDFVMAMGVLG